jgi:hypothetical protein
MRWLISWVDIGGVEKRERKGESQTVVGYLSTIMNSHRNAMMTTKRTAYELLLNRSTNAVEKHYCPSEIEVSNMFSYLNSGHLMPINSNRTEHT